MQRLLLRSASVAVLGFSFSLACARGSDVLPEDENPCTGLCSDSGSGGNTTGTGGGGPSDVGGKFELAPEWSGECVKAPGAIDVNLGHSPENFVRAAFCQINGSEPDEALVTTKASELRTYSYVRRIDVVRQLCKDAGKSCSLSYSNPWATQVLHEETCTKKNKRDLGSVFMFFSECSGGVNCDMDWANTHALGMAKESSVYASDARPAGLYHPGNPGFWKRELLDARYAGISFLALNVYGPDILRDWKPLELATEAIDSIGGGIKLALFDDTWGWGKGDKPWSEVPNLASPDAAAKLIYESKWKPFFDQVDPEHRYEYQGKPLIYFYNAGTLTPRNQAAAVIAKLKALFEADNGVEPFMVIDTAFFEDPAMETTADARFTWNTFALGDMSRSDLKGTTFDHFMTKWDTMGRDHIGAIATSSDLIVKDDALLTDYLGKSADADLAVVATWNDLGEGTGIHRNYDYYVKGEWKEPTWMLSKVRAAECQ